jgi:hypothetical protein
VRDVKEDIGSLDPYDRGDALEIASRALAVEMVKREVAPAVTIDEVTEHAELPSSQPSSSSPPAARRPRRWRAMWVLTTDERHALYNISAFEVVFALKDVTDVKQEKWLVQAADRDGEHGVLLAETDDQRSADNIVRVLAAELGAMDLGPQ